MKQYYYYSGTEKFGPMSLSELKTRNIGPNTLVWHEGLSDWKPANTIPELQMLFMTTVGSAQGQQQPAAQPSSSSNPYRQQQKPANMPKLGVLKVFSILGMLLSILLFIMAFLVGEMRGWCWGDDYSYCYPYNRDEYAIIIGFLAIFFLFFSIIAAVKSFKRYG